MYPRHPEHVHYFVAGRLSTSIIHGMDKTRRCPFQETDSISIYSILYIPNFHMISRAPCYTGSVQTQSDIYFSKSCHQIAFQCWLVLQVTNMQYICTIDTTLPICVLQQFINFIRAMVCRQCPRTVSTTGLELLFLRCKSISFPNFLVLAFFWHHNNYECY